MQHGGVAIADKDIGAGARVQHIAEILARHQRRHIQGHVAGNLARDFRPVSLLAKVPSLYLVHPDLPVRNMSEFIAHAKKNPGRLNYGSAGNGSAGHLAMEYLKMASGTFIEPAML